MADVSVLCTYGRLYFNPSLLALQLNLWILGRSEICWELEVWWYSYLTSCIFWVSCWPSILLTLLSISSYLNIFTWVKDTGTYSCPIHRSTVVDEMGKIISWSWVKIDEFAGSKLTIWYEKFQPAVKREEICVASNANSIWNSQKYCLQRVPFTTSATVSNCQLFWIHG